MLRLRRLCGNHHTNAHTHMYTRPHTHVRAPLSDIQACNLDCLADESFQFPGASRVTDVNIQGNNFAALPEKLLWNMTSMLFFFARTLKKLQTVRALFRAAVGLELDFEDPVV